MTDPNENNKNNSIERQIKSSQDGQDSYGIGGPARGAAFYRSIHVDLYSAVRFCLTTNINKEAIEQIVERVVQAFQENPFNDLLFLAYADAKEDYLSVHITSDVIFSVAFGVNLGLSRSDVMDIAVCAFCHDFGMADYLSLFQKTTKLTAEENILIQKHPQKSAEIFKPFFSDKIINAVIDIHEQFDGNGYPMRKAGIEISTIGKIVAICDAFVALTHSRKYRKAFSPYESIKMIIKQKDIIFDPKILKKFINFLSIYPIGSLVYLNTGETAIIVGSNPNKPTRSIVRILLNIKREVDRSNRLINLLDDPMLYIRGCVDSTEEAEILHFLKPRGENEIS
ncbi:MAG: HD domain-containing protein [Candidatus Omnitrophica bacterium]|nr:HD domain-containing protein [Candidatus Omnitrophota bacterium]